MPWTEDIPPAKESEFLFEAILEPRNGPAQPIQLFCSSTLTPQFPMFPGFEVYSVRKIGYMKDGMWETWHLKDVPIGKEQVVRNY